MESLHVSFQLGLKEMGKGSTLTSSNTGCIKPEEVLSTKADSCIMRSLLRPKSISCGRLNRCTQQHRSTFWPENAETELQFRSSTMHWTLDFSQTTKRSTLRIKILLEGAYIMAPRNPRSLCPKAPKSEALGIHPLILPEGQLKICREWIPQRISCTRVMQ